MFFEKIAKMCQGDGFLAIFAKRDKFVKENEYFSQRTMSRDGPITIRYKSRLII